MGSRMLRKFEHVIFDGIDIDPRQISVKAGPRLRYDNGNGETERRCGLHRTRTRSLRLLRQSLKPKEIGKRSKGVGTTVITDLPELRLPGCFGIGVERTLKMQSSLRMTSQAMLGYAEHPLRHRPDSRIGNLLRRVDTSFSNVECLLIVRLPHCLSPKGQICGYFPFYIVETDSKFQGLSPG